MRTSDKRGMAVAKRVRALVIEKNGDRVWFDDNKDPFFPRQRAWFSKENYIELQRSSEDVLRVVGMSRSEGLQYEVELTREGRYRFHPMKGSFIIPSSEESDPVKRELRAMGVPMVFFKYESDERWELKECRCRKKRCKSPCRTNRWLHDGHATQLGSESFSLADKNYSCDGRHAFGVEGASYAIRVNSGWHPDGERWSQLSAVIVQKGCDPAVLVSVLAPILFRGMVDARCVEALKDFDVAQRLVAERYKIVPHPSRGGLILVDGGDFSLNPGDAREPRVLDHLVTRHGLRLVRDYLGRSQRHFFREQRRDPSEIETLRRNRSSRHRKR